MKKIAVDLTGATGLACLAGGLYRQYGAGTALICVGVLLVSVAIVAAVRGGR